MHNPEFEHSARKWAVETVLHHIGHQGHLNSADTAKHITAIAQVLVDYLVAAPDSENTYDDGIVGA